MKNMTNANYEKCFKLVNTGQIKRFFDTWAKLLVNKIVFRKKNLVIEMRKAQVKLELVCRGISIPDLIKTRKSIIRK